MNRRRLLDRIAYNFQDKSLLELALTHRSYGLPNNERLEFLGDSILNFVIGEVLYEQFPQAKEGQLSRLRAQLVKGETLAAIALEFDLGSCLNLGEGELKSGGRRRCSILADAVEALIGAIYLEAGMAACQRCILAWYEDRLTSLTITYNTKDPKTQLQEYLQARKLALPSYHVVEISGQSHAQIFTVECRSTLLTQPTIAKASSRRSAEKLSAALALKQLQVKN